MEDLENKDLDARVYEVGYLLAPTIPEGEAPVVYNSLKELIASFDGEIISDEMPKMIGLAYAMPKVLQNVRHKFDTAYFGWIKFSMDPEKVLKLKKKLDLDLNFIRFLILKTVKENTIATKRFVHRDVAHRRLPVMRKKGGSEDAVPINKEEIDKEIEAMVKV